MKTNVNTVTPEVKNELEHIGANLNFATAESYNLLRANISFAIPEKKGARVIGVTSPCPQEGKSFTSINLAYALAKDAKKVLLIDADMRCPSVCTKIDLPMAPGLSNLVIGDKADGAIHENVLIEGLSILLSGDVPPNPSELIGSDSMKALIGDFQTKYDYIIVDLPPVNPVSDPLVMSSLLDGILVVVMHKLSRRKEIKEAVSRLKFANAKILGFVYNGYGVSSGYGKKKSYKKYKSNYYKSI